MILRDGKDEMFIEEIMLIHFSLQNSAGLVPSEQKVLA